MSGRVASITAIPSEPGPEAVRRSGGELAERVAPSSSQRRHEELHDQAVVPSSPLRVAALRADLHAGLDQANSARPLTLPLRERSRFRSAPRAARAPPAPAPS